jgi:hypothetical protein
VARRSSAVCPDLPSSAASSHIWTTTARDMIAAGAKVLALMAIDVLGLSEDL